MKKTKNELVENFCTTNNLTIDQFYGRQEVGGDLDLRSVTSLPDGFNPTVGGDLYLGSVTSLPDGFKDLQSWKKARIKKPIGKLNTPKNKLLVWQDGKYVKADGIFTEVVNKKGNIYKVKKSTHKKSFI